MSEHYFIIVDQRHFRIFKMEKGLDQQVHTLRAVESLDLLDAHGSYTKQNADRAGRFPNARAGQQGMSIDERLPLQEEYERRLIEQIATRIDEFLREHSQDKWSFSAGPKLHQAVLQKLSSAHKGTLRESVQKDLTNLPTQELLGHFHVGAHAVGLAAATAANR